MIKCSRRKTDSCVVGGEPKEIGSLTVKEKVGEILACLDFPHEVKHVFYHYQTLSWNAGFGHLQDVRKPGSWNTKPLLHLPLKVLQPCKM